jgi:hypothetical protein
MLFNKVARIFFLLKPDQCKIIYESSVARIYLTRF